MNNKLKTILKAIQKVNPELMELSFGCGVKTRFGRYSMITSPVATDSDLNEYVSSTKGHNIEKIYLKPLKHENKITEILGHQPTLEHVMKTLRKTDKDVLVNLEGTITVIGEEGASWELGQDLFHQPKEVIDFLYNLLKEEK